MNVLNQEYWFKSHRMPGHIRKKKKKAGSQLHHTKTQIRCVRVAGLEEVPMINKNTEESPKIKAFSAVASRSHASIEESSHSVLL